jgi:hypothetical protein
MRPSCPRCRGSGRGGLSCLCESRRRGPTGRRGVVAWGVWPSEYVRARIRSWPWVGARGTPQQGRILRPGRRPVWRPDAAHATPGLRDGLLPAALAPLLARDPASRRSPRPGGKACPQASRKRVRCANDLCLNVPYMLGKSRNRLTPVLTVASSLTSDRRRRGLFGSFGIQREYGTDDPGQVGTVINGAQVLSRRVPSPSRRTASMLR